MAKYGEIRRYEPPRESLAGLIAITVFTIIEFILVVIFLMGLLSGNVTDMASNVFLGAVLGFIFIDLALILMVYKMEFLPDVLVVKKRRKKPEDIWIAEEDVEGESMREKFEQDLKKSSSPFERKI